MILKYLQIRSFLIMKCRLWDDGETLKRPLQFITMTDARNYRRTPLHLTVIRIFADSNPSASAFTVKAFAPGLALTITRASPLNAFR